MNRAAIHRTATAACPPAGTAFMVVTLLGFVALFTWPALSAPLLYVALVFATVAVAGAVTAACVDPHDTESEAPE